MPASKIDWSELALQQVVNREDDLLFEQGIAKAKKWLNEVFEAEDQIRNHPHSGSKSCQHNGLEARWVYVGKHYRMHYTVDENSVVVIEEVRHKKLFY
ncbi:type II toxin-antitoxin system RelE/ParE family toxin [Gallaecimonas xiamenensis]|uniref:type II toxin-antitoxin system RelE/ParE family toxin n=1 Tax=Gallaecimonas xiamenensis TaxID=1207039 RepID=UPI000A000448|nr:type II toxin-antitoxin system RelE/ParE family toxin [Gallaecimonas xiamenensis]